MTKILRKSLTIAQMLQTECIISASECTQKLFMNEDSSSVTYTLSQEVFIFLNETK